jgi:hypothetical protein
VAQPGGAYGEDVRLRMSGTTAVPKAQDLRCLGSEAFDLVFLAAAIRAHIVATTSSPRRPVVVRRRFPGISKSSNN